MVDIVYTELLKLKRLAILWFIMLISLLNAGLSYYQIEGNSALSWELLTQTSVSNLNSALVGIIFAIVVGFVICREYQQKTVHQLFTYPHSRVRILLGKLALVFLMLTLTIILSAVIILILGFAIIADPLKTTDLLKIVGLHGLTIILQFSLLPFVVFISIITQSYIPAIVIGIVTSLSKNILILTSLGSFFPWTVPKIIFLHFLGVELGDLVSGLIILVSFFIVSLWLSFWHYHRSEIV